MCSNEALGGIVRRHLEHDPNQGPTNRISMASTRVVCTTGQTWMPGVLLAEELSCEKHTGSQARAAEYAVDSGIHRSEETA